MQGLRSRSTNLVENLSALMLLLPLVFCAYRQDKWPLCCCLHRIHIPGRLSPLTISGLLRRSPNTPHGGARESWKLASSAPTGEGTLYLKNGNSCSIFAFASSCRTGLRVCFPECKQLESVLQITNRKVQGHYILKWRDYPHKKWEKTLRNFTETKDKLDHSQVKSGCATFWVSCSQRPQNLKHNGVKAGPPAKCGPQSLHTKILFVTTKVGWLCKYFIID